MADPQDRAAPRIAASHSGTTAGGTGVMQIACACGRHARDAHRIEVCLPCRRAFSDGFWWPADEIIALHPTWPVELLDRVCPDCGPTPRRGDTRVSG